MEQRQALLESVAGLIEALPRDHIVRVGIDGVDGSGKSHFADEIAFVLSEREHIVVRASLDGFHNPRDIRHRLGRHSPEGFFRDSYNYVELKRVLLDPLSPGGSRRYRAAVFDHVSNAPISLPKQVAAKNSILIVDGIFLHRPELRDYWDFSIFLEVDFTVSVPRCIARDRGFNSPDPAAEENRRYVEGQKLYFNECQPRAHSALVIDNNDLAAPFFVTDPLK